MRAQYKPRIRLEGRPTLQDVIPLGVPFIINVDPSDRCNLRCRFCPTGDHNLMRATRGRNHGPMDIDLFKKIVNSICKFPKPIKVLRLYKDGEPLSNPQFASMVLYAKQSGCCEVVDTTTNAVLLSPRKNVEIIEAGLDRINISIYGVCSEQYEQFSRREVNFNALVENIRHLHENRGTCKILIKINGDVISDEDKQVFLETFGDICDEIFIEHIMSCWSGFGLEERGVRANELVGIYDQPIKEVVVCPYIFYSFSINSDGIASVCFLDWNRKLVIGDAKTESVVDIWNGVKLRTHQIMMLKGERKDHPICGNCDQLKRGMPDDIDAHASVLLQKIEALI